MIGRFSGPLNSVVEPECVAWSRGSGSGQMGNGCMEGVNLIDPKRAQTRLVERATCSVPSVAVGQWRVHAAGWPN